MSARIELSPKEQFFAKGTAFWIQQARTHIALEFLASRGRLFPSQDALLQKFQQLTESDGRVQKNQPNLHEVYDNLRQLYGTDGFPRVYSAWKKQQQSQVAIEGNRNGSHTQISSPEPVKRW